MEVLWRHHPSRPSAWTAIGRAGRPRRGAGPGAAAAEAGKSFKFASIEGGRTPTTCCATTAGGAAGPAEKTTVRPGPVARERDLEPLDTRSGHGAEGALRKLAASIVDGDLASAYKEDLLGARAALATGSRSTGGAADGSSPAAVGQEKTGISQAGATPQGRQAAWSCSNPRGRWPPPWRGRRCTIRP